jgi:hypothetical protein
MMQQQALYPQVYEVLDAQSQYDIPDVAPQGSFRPNLVYEATTHEPSATDTVELAAR